MRYEEWIMGVDNSNKYTWDDFKNRRFGFPYHDDLCEFFNSLLKLWEEENRTVIVFISRRAFCLFLLMSQKGYLAKWENVKVYSDRYVKKKLQFDFWENQRIILVDDSLITGRHMKKAYRMLREKATTAQIIPYVFALESNWENVDLKSVDSAFANLKHEFYYPYNDILRLSSIESLLFYKCGIPYMVELPVFTGKEDEKLGASFSKKEFKLLQSGIPELWTYRECEQIGYLQNEMISGCLILGNNILKRRFSEFIQNLTVRLHIIPEDDGVRIIFMPFAILKSVEFISLKSMALNLYEDTKYAEEIAEFEKLCLEKGKSFEKESFIGLYRAVVYSLSYYIGAELRKYIKFLFGKELIAFEGYNKFSFEKSFLESIKEVFETKSDNNGYIRRTLAETPFKKVECSKDIKELCKNIPWREYSYNHVYNSMLDIKNQYSSLQHDLKTNQELFLTIEEVQQFVENYCLINVHEHIDNCVSACISGMLCQGLLVNDLYYDSEKKVVYRGFTFGENSDVLYSVSAKVFYAGVFKYYEKVGRDQENYERMYNYFIMHLFYCFRINSLFEIFIDRDEFDFYARYFKGALNSVNQIENKKFLLDEPDTPYYISTVEAYISGLDFEH